MGNTYRIAQIPVINRFFSESNNLIIEETNVLVSNCLFHDMTISQGNGGAISDASSQQLLIELTTFSNCKVTSNDAEGGALYLDNSNTVINQICALECESSKDDSFAKIFIQSDSDGKNIVKVLLENYGYRVIDLGKDVPPEQIVQAAVEHQAKLVGLSALMTTTVSAMEDTIRALREAAECKVLVGGAVLTEEYAAAIGADGYAPNAVSAVNYANRIFAR